MKQKGVQLRFPVKALLICNRKKNGFCRSPHGVRKQWITITKSSLLKTYLCLLRNGYSLTTRYLNVIKCFQGGFCHEISVKMYLQISASRHKPTKNSNCKMFQLNLLWETNVTLITFFVYAYVMVHLEDTCFIFTFIIHMVWYVIRRLCQNKFPVACKSEMLASQ